MECSMQEAPRIRIRGFVTWRVPAVSIDAPLQPMSPYINRQRRDRRFTYKAKELHLEGAAGDFHASKMRVVACTVCCCMLFRSVCFLHVSLPHISASIFSVMLSHVPSVFFSSCIVLYHVIIGRLGWILFHMWIWTRCMTIPTGNQSNHTETLHNKRKHIYTTHVLIIPAAPFHLARPLFLVVDYCTCRFLSSPTPSAAMLCQVISCHILVDYMSYYVVTIFRI